MTLYSQAAVEGAAAVFRRLEARGQAIRREWLRYAQDLHQFSEQSMWRTLGYETFEECLASPEIALNRAHAFQMIAIWEQLVVQRNVEPEAIGAADVSQVITVLPAIRKGTVDAEDALADAQALSRSDLREKYRGKTPNEPLNAEEEPEHIRCPVCGQWTKATGEST